MADASAALAALDAKINALLPPQYQSCYDEVSPSSMGSAELRYGPDGKVAWDEIWTTSANWRSPAAQPIGARCWRPSLPRKPSPTRTAPGRWRRRSPRRPHGDRVRVHPQPNARLGRRPLRRRGDGRLAGPGHRGRERHRPPLGGRAFPARRATLPTAQGDQERHHLAGQDPSLLGLPHAGRAAGACPARSSSRRPRPRPTRSWKSTTPSWTRSPGIVREATGLSPCRVRRWAGSACVLSRRGDGRLADAGRHRRGRPRAAARATCSICRRPRTSHRTGRLGGWWRHGEGVPVLAGKCRRETRTVPPAVTAPLGSTFRRLAIASVTGRAKPPEGGTPTTAVESQLRGPVSTTYSEGPNDALAHRHSRPADRAALLPAAGEKARTFTFQQGRGRQAPEGLEGRPHRQGRGQRLEGRGRRHGPVEDRLRARADRGGPERRSSTSASSRTRSTRTSRSAWRSRR